MFDVPCMMNMKLIQSFQPTRTISTEWHSACGLETLEWFNIPAVYMHTRLIVNGILIDFLKKVGS